MDAAREEVDELRGVLRGRIWIGALLPAGDLDVPGLLARFSRAHPGVEVGLREGIAADMLRLLAADELDAAFCLLAGELPDELAVERLADEEVVAAFAPDRAPAGPHVAVADLAGHRDRRAAPRLGHHLGARRALRRRRRAAPPRPGERRPVPAARARRARLRHRDPPPLAHRAGRAGVEVRSLHPAVHLPVALVWRRERNAPPAARAFIDFVRRGRSGGGDLQPDGVADPAPVLLR